MKVHINLLSIWINLAVYGVDQDSFVEPDKEEEERLQVECNKEIIINFMYILMDRSKMQSPIRWIRMNTSIILNVDELTFVSRSISSPTLELIYYAIVSER